eukprot:3656904-Amphidinium_carterae.1
MVTTRSPADDVNECGEGCKNFDEILEEMAAWLEEDTVTVNEPSPEPTELECEPEPCGKSLLLHQSSHAAQNARAVHYVATNSGLTVPRANGIAFDRAAEPPTQVCGFQLNCKPQCNGLLRKTMARFFEQNRVRGVGLRDSNYKALTSDVPNWSRTSHGPY